MSAAAEHLYNKLDTEDALRQLIGQPEDADFDCKQWPERADAQRGTIAKAACGFTNATGGVIIIGLTAAGRGSDTPDVVQSLAPVADREAVASITLDIILKFVEPGVEGVAVKTIPTEAARKTGYVVLLIPESDSSVRRSRHDSRFYVRIASGTVPMEYFQIEERFGRRPQPKLTLHIEPQAIITSSGFNQSPLRHLELGLRNDGRGIAKFPGIRLVSAPGLKRSDFGIDGNGGFGLPPRPTPSTWIVFRGGVDDVIYPGELRLIDSLIQSAVNKGESVKSQAGMPVFGVQMAERLWMCEGFALQYEISCEGLATQSGEYMLAADSLTQEFQIRSPRYF